MGDDIAEDEFHLKAETTYRLSGKADLTGGVFWKGIDSNHRIWSIADTTRTGAISPAYRARYDAPFTFKAGSHLQAVLRPAPRLSLSAGARCDYYEFTGESKVSPRLGLTYALTQRTTLNAAYGHFHQTPGTHQVAMHPENTARCPAYHKLDVRIDRSFRFRDWTLLAHLDLWNAYGRDNVVSYWYEMGDDGAITRKSSSGFPLFPILGLSARF